MLIIRNRKTYKLINTLSYRHQLLKLKRTFILPARSGVFVITIQPLVLPLCSLAFVSAMEFYEVVFEVPGELNNSPEMFVCDEDLAVLVLLGVVFCKGDCSLEGCSLNVSIRLNET